MYGTSVSSKVQVPNCHYLGPDFLKRLINIINIVMEKSLQNKEIIRAKTKKLSMSGSYTPNSHLIDLRLSTEIFF